MHTIYEVVDASVNHSSSSKTLRVKLTVSPEPFGKRREGPPAGQGEGPGLPLRRPCFNWQPPPPCSPLPHCAFLHSPPHAEGHGGITANCVYCSAPPPPQGKISVLS